VGREEEIGRGQVGKPAGRQVSLGGAMGGVSSLDCEIVGIDNRSIDMYTQMWT
jgi:hypothetical protein